MPQGNFCSSFPVKEKVGARPEFLQADPPVHPVPPGQSIPMDVLLAALCFHHPLSHKEKRSSLPALRLMGLPAPSTASHTP